MQKAELHCSSSLVLIHHEQSPGDRDYRNKRIWEYSQKVSECPRRETMKKAMQTGRVPEGLLLKEIKPALKEKLAMRQTFKCHFTFHIDLFAPGFN